MKFLGNGWWHFQDAASAAFKQTPLLGVPVSLTTTWTDHHSMKEDISLGLYSKELLSDGQIESMTAQLKAHDIGFTYTGGQNGEGSHINLKLPNRDAVKNLSDIMQAPAIVGAVDANAEAHKADANMRSRMTNMVNEGKAAPNMGFVGLVRFFADKSADLWTRKIGDFYEMGPMENVFAALNNGAPENVAAYLGHSGEIAARKKPTPQQMKAARDGIRDLYIARAIETLEVDGAGNVLNCEARESIDYDASREMEAVLDANGISSRALPMKCGAGFTIENGACKFSHRGVYGYDFNNTEGVFAGRSFTGGPLAAEYQEWLAKGVEPIVKQAPAALRQGGAQPS